MSRSQRRFDDDDDDDDDDNDGDNDDNDDDDDDDGDDGNDDENDCRDDDDGVGGGDDDEYDADDDDDEFYLRHGGPSAKHLLNHTKLCVKHTYPRQISGTNLPSPERMDSLVSKSKCVHA